MIKSTCFRLIFSGLFIFSLGVTMLGITTTTASAHARIPSSCTWDEIGANEVTLGDGHSLYAFLFGNYNPSGYFCGQLYADALEYAPAHTTSGNLGAILEDCYGNAQATASTVAPSGGLHGTSDYANTNSITLSCGKACASFYGYDPYPGATQGSVCTGNIIGSPRK